MKMVGDSCKTSSMRKCIGMQNHLDPWSLVFTSFLLFQIFFKVIFIFKSCWALLSLNSCCVHKYSFVSKLVSCLELHWSRVSFNYLLFSSRDVRNSRELMVIQRQNVNNKKKKKIKKNDLFGWICAPIKEKNEMKSWPNQLFLANALKKMQFLEVQKMGRKIKKKMRYWKW